MTNQISIFEADLDRAGNLTTQDNIISFPVPETKHITRKANYRKGEEQRVYPIKKSSDLTAMATWLKENKDPKYLLGFILGINLGLRANELLSLRYADILFPDGSLRYIADDAANTTDSISVYQEKVHKKRKIYLNKACVAALGEYFKSTGMNQSLLVRDAYIFPSREGGCINVDTFRKVLKEAADACGIKQNIGTHTLRKTFGYFHFKANNDVVFLQRLFGHSSALITMRYIGMADEEDKRAYHSVCLDPLGTI